MPDCRMLIEMSHERYRTESPRVSIRCASLCDKNDEPPVHRMQFILAFSVNYMKEMKQKKSRNESNRNTSRIWPIV